MLSQLILKLVQQAGTVTTVTTQINDLGEFLLNNIPYGKVSLNDFIPGFVEYDGPAQPIPTPKPALQWHFGGQAYTITKAIRIQYSYMQVYDNIEMRQTGSLFIGFQVPVPPHPAAPRPVPPPPNPATPVAGNVGAIIQALREEGNYDVAVHPSTILTVAQPILPDIGQFVRGLDPYNRVPFIAPAAHLPGILGRPLDVEYDGPAQNYNTGEPFPYSQSTLFNERDKYDQLLWWYFGGKPYGITKAIRVPYTRFDPPFPPVPPPPLPAGIDEFVFFGYQGPGNFP